MLVRALVRSYAYGHGGQKTIRQDTFWTVADAGSAYEQEGWRSDDYQLLFADRFANEDEPGWLCLHGRYRNAMRFQKITPVLLGLFGHVQTINLGHREGRPIPGTVSDRHFLSVRPGLDAGDLSNSRARTVALHMLPRVGVIPA